MELQVTFPKGTTKYMAIYEHIKQLILQQQLKAHSRMPSKRELANQLNVSIFTVQEAYAQLLSEGYLYSTERKGYFVGEIEVPFQEEDVLQKEEFLPTIKEESLNFRNGQVDPIEFPYKVWNCLYQKFLAPAHVANGCWQGEPELRNEIANYLRQSRGLHCQAKQIFIFSGTQQQLSSLCQFLLPSKIGMEEPGFVRANVVFHQLNIPVLPLRLDSEGCTVPKQAVTLLYTTPAHQYPLGTVMSINRRLELLSWAKASSSYIVEDDYDSEFRYRGASIPTLAHLDALNQVIYFGSFSKTLLPSIRISYLVLPLSLMKEYEAFNALQKPTVSKIDQLVVAEFIKTGGYEKHIAKMRTLYRSKRKCLIEAIDEFLGEDFSVKGDEAGLHIIVQLPAYLTEQEAIARADSLGIEVDSVSHMYQETKSTDRVIIGYGAPTIGEIRKGIQWLASVWKSP
ncbi:MocR-like pyridoxine biosynthesis transcription factor PdxR [Planococcus chinensis]|uniref:MocR-like pyridoxine biosynthesis transcription factor PdxR n=1 Tax=Planococcus chinensis TaxID=272917 RepID=UPI001CC47D15|nr:PLP-dependent aminotransferase family protein [Planococcus chinensis]